MNAPRGTESDPIDLLVATPRTRSGTEAARVRPGSPGAPARDSFTRLPHRPEPDAEAPWAQARPLAVGRRGVPVIGGSTPAKPYARRIEPATRHWSGKRREVIRGINPIALLWAGGDLRLMAQGRGSTPEYARFDGWYASTGDLEQVRGRGRRRITRSAANRAATPGGRTCRTPDGVAIGAAGVVARLRGCVAG